YQLQKKKGRLQAAKGSKLLNFESFVSRISKGEKRTRVFGIAAFALARFREKSLRGLEKF
ncbi:MAG TPA: hypothetical protein DIV38_01845, partial [Clostridiales bacterium]|nr:hypothetical protein [Clostridiales bacterium]